LPIRAGLIFLAILLSVMASALPAHAAAPTIKVAIIVGPVGDLTPLYLRLAEDAAAAAEAAGADVARAYSPEATPANVLEAVEDANIVIYYGHGTGFPNPYSSYLNPASYNGWGLQGPRARGTHEDSFANGTLKYYGEEWIAANAKPAPGFIMIYSNTCYAPGAGEGKDGPATPAQAQERVGYYSRAPLTMGASAYFAIDFTYGASRLVRNILSDPTLSYGDVFAAEDLYQSAAVTSLPHPLINGAQILLHRTHYLNGELNYWYAFAGDPTASAASSWDDTPPALQRVDPDADEKAVARDTSVIVEFDEPLFGVFDDAVTLHDGLGNEVAGSVWYNPDIYRITFLPDKPLAEGAEYTLELGDVIRDRMGNAIKTQSLFFRTWGPTTGDDLFFGTPRSATLNEGEHDIFAFDEDGKQTDKRTISAGIDTRLAVSARVSIAGHPGMYLAIAGGENAGFYLPERAAVSYLPGVAWFNKFAEPRPLILPAGEYGHYRLLVDDWFAVPVQAVKEELEVAIDAHAVINGESHLRIADGEMAGLWIKETIETVLAD